MPQLVSPSAALGQAFVLPKVNTEQAKSVNVALTQERTVIGYGVTVGNMGLILPSGVASRLVETDTALCHLPTAPAWLLGMANLQGSAVPIFDIETLLGFERNPAPMQYLILGEGDEAVGIALNNRPQRLRLEPEQKLARNPPLPATLQPYVINCYRKDNVWVEWDFYAFFDAVGKRI